MKLCKRCGFVKPLVCFNKKAASKDGYASLCKEHTREMVRSWYRKNIDTERVRLKEKKKVYTDRNKKLIMEIKDNPCADCGNRYPHYIMDFDHRPGTNKCFQISDAFHARAAMPVNKILTEISKCDLVCANCHRERTFGRSRD